MPRIRFHKLAAVLVFAGAALWVGSGEFSSVGSAVTERQPARPVEPAPAPVPILRTVAVVAPPRVEHARAIRISGVTEANRRTRLAARNAGIIAELPVEQGRTVKEGDIVLRLDAEGKAAAVEMARTMLTQREAELAAAERLARTGNMAKLQLDNARTALSAAKSQLETAEAELARNELRAPFDGLVDRVVVERGSTVQQGAEVATILDLDPILVVGEVSERDLSMLRLGNGADIRLVSGTKVAGTLRYVSRDASAQTRTFRVEVAVANADNRIPAGMTAEITLRADRVPAVFLPRSVVTLSNAGDLGVRVVRNGIVEFVPIDLIDDTPQGLVLGGVAADARIIVAGQDLVSDGDRVNAVEADAETVRKLVGEVTAGRAN